MAFYGKWRITPGSSAWRQVHLLFVDGSDASDGGYEFPNGSQFEIPVSGKRWILGARTVLPPPDFDRPITLKSSMRYDAKRGLIIEMEGYALGYPLRLLCFCDDPEATVPKPSHPYNFTHPGAMEWSD